MRRPYPLFREGDNIPSLILYYLEFLTTQELKILGSAYNLSLLLCPGDEVLSVNGRGVQGLSHEDAIAEFRNIKSGPVLIYLARRQLVPRRSVCSTVQYYGYNLWGAVRLCMLCVM